MIGNLSLDPLGVLIDGASAGTVPAGSRNQFPVEPGKHTVQVDSGGRRSAVRRIEPKRNGTVRMAFDAASGVEAIPEPVEAAKFTGRRSLGGSLGCLFPVLVLAGVAVASPGEDLLAPAVGILLIGVFISILLWSDSAYQLILRGGELELNSDPKKAIRWKDLVQVSVVGEGSDAKLVVWPHADLPGPLGADFQGGKVLCAAGIIGAADPHDTERLRAALRWFAGDIWVEQPPAP